MNDSVKTEQPKTETVVEKTSEPQLNIVQVGQGTGRYIYSVFHSIMSLVAIYLSFRCNNGFETGPFLFALFCPYIYIIYILATRGTCGIIQGELITKK